MKTHSLPTMTATVILLISTLAVAAPATEHVSVLLKGHDQPIDGFLRNISDSRFLLQGEDVYYEFPQNQIVSVDGRADIPDHVYGQRRLIFSSFYEKILPNGDVEVWLRVDSKNTGSTMLTTTDWGVGPHELAEARERSVFDGFGNRLRLELVPAENGLYRQIAHLVVPIAPRETISLALKTVRQDAVRREGDDLVYKFNVGFSEDRYLFRKVELPAGAELQKAYHGCQGLVHDGRHILVSQHYYPAFAEEPLVIRFRMK